MASDISNELNGGVQFSNRPSFKDVGLKSPFTEFVPPLAGIRDNEWRPSGTAVIIGTHLAITAKHVMTDFWNTYEDSEPAENSSGAFSVIAIQIVENGKTGNLWTVTRAFCSGFTDVAFLQLMPRSVGAGQYRWARSKLSLLPPKVGSRIMGFGYHSSKVKITSNTDDELGVEWFDCPTVTCGEVTEVYEDRRDAVMLPFPCFSTNARFEHGMSGGPIFNETGELCGLICSGLTPLGEEYTSYGACLWPSMATEIDIPYEGFPPGAKYPCIELARRGIITAADWERVSISGANQVSLRCPKRT